MLTINLEWDANAETAPQSFRNAVQAAANVLDAAIYDPITVNIEVGYGEYDNGGTYYEPLTDYSLGGIAPLSGVPVAYSLLRAALANDASSPSDVEAVDALPDTAALNGQSSFFVAGAQAKALGAIPANDPAIDGYVGFPTSFSGNGLIAAGIVELIHAMGMLSDGDGPLTLFEFTGAGDHLLTAGFTSTVPSYFSIDGGVTNLANYDVSFDDTLFSNVSGDPLSVPNTGATVLTPLDLTEIGAIGFDDTSTPSIPAPSLIPTATAAGATASVTVQDITLLENTAVSALTFVTSVAAPSGDAITDYEFYDQGQGSGHFAIGGVVEPDGQWIAVLSTQLSSFQYVAGASPGTDDLYVAPFDYTADKFAQISSLFATTTAPAPLTITGTQTGQTTSDASSVAPFRTVTIIDPNPAQTDAVTITLSAAANGTLSNVGGGTYNATTGVYTVSGSAASVTAALDGLVFEPTLLQTTPGQTVTTIFTIAVSDAAGETASNGTTSILTTETADPHYNAVVAAYQGILRATPAPASADRIALQITAGQTTLAGYEAGLIDSETALYTTLPALVTIDAFYDATPASGLLTSVATATAGTAYYTAAGLHNLGYSDPNVWTILGAGWGADHGSEFYTLYHADASGTTSGYTSFIDEVYQTEFGGQPTAANQQNLLSDIPGLAALLSGGGNTASPIQVMGGLFGYLLYAGQSNSVGHYAAAADAFLLAAANGTVTYGPELTAEFPSTTVNATAISAMVSSAGGAVAPAAGDNMIRFIGGGLIPHAGGGEQVAGFDAAMVFPDPGPTFSTAGAATASEFVTIAAQPSGANLAMLNATPPFSNDMFQIVPRA